MEIEGEVKPDFEAMIKRSRGVAEAMVKAYNIVEKNAIDVIEGLGKLGEGKSVVVTNIEGNDTIYNADHIILATGARSRVLPNVPQDGKKIIGYREALTLPSLPESMLIVGSGAIGSEFAFFYNSLGVKTTINRNFLPNVLPVEDEEISKQVERAFRKQGMKVMIEASVESVTVEDDKCHVTVKDKKGNVVAIDVDIVLSAVGVQTNVEKLGLEEAGVKVEYGKIIVDEYYRTNVEGVYAIGDIVHGPALAHVASQEAIVCVEKIAGKNPEKVDYKNIPGCTYTMPEVASVGLTEAKAIAEGYEVKVGKFPFTASGKATAAGNRDGMVKVIFDAKTNQLLGCHMVGDNVTEMIAEAVVARKANMNAHQLLSSIHPHPTMSEAVKEAIEAAYGEAIHL